MKKAFPSKRKPGVASRNWRRLFVILSLGISLLLPISEANAQWFLFGRAQRRYNKCIELYEAKQFDQARQCIKEFISDYPHSRWVEHLQFVDARMETNVSLAVEKWRAFLLEYPDGPYSAEANFRLGEIHELNGDLTDALKCYSRVYLYFKSSGFRDEAGLRMAKLMLLMSNVQSAKAHLEAYLAEHKSWPWKTRAMELHADALYQSGQLADAQNEYREIISEASSPDLVSPRCYVRTAEIYEKDGNPRAALQTYRRFLSIFPNSAQKPEVERRVARLAAVLGVDVSESDKAQVIEAGSFASESEATGLVVRLKRFGYQAYVVTKTAAQGNAFSVRLGPYETRDSALAVADRLSKEAGLKVTLLPLSATAERKLQGE